MLTIVVFLLLQTVNPRAELQEGFYKIVKNSVLFDETPISVKISESQISCSQLCTNDKRCKSANFVKSQKTCSSTALFETSQRNSPGKGIFLIDNI